LTAATALEEAPSIGRPLTHGSLGVIWGTQNNSGKGHKMRKSIYLIGACVLGVAAILVWPQDALVSSRANTAAAMSPTRIDISEMHRNITALPEEKFHDMTFAFVDGD
jgi:hypothetical protein